MVMWELIRANKRKSWILFIAMGACLLLLGYLIGAAFSPRGGGTTGLVIALIVWTFLSLISYSAGDSILLSLSKAKPVTHDVHPQLFNVVEEMKIAANLPHMPKVYIIPERAPNAFATGIKPEKSAIAVTAGLLSSLNRDELQGVVAHEMSHITNRDVLFMSLAGIMLGTIVLVAEVFLRGVWHSAGSTRRYESKGSSKGDGQARLVIMIVAIVFAILAPIMARLLYFAMSRKREYLADASAVRLTRYPGGLASALKKISSTTLDLRSANKVTAPMYIINPLKPKGRRVSNLTSTHPPIKERIRILRSMMHGAAFVDYQKAFSKIKHSPAHIIPPSGLRDTEAVPLRKPSVRRKEEKPKKKAMRDLGDLMRAVNQYAFLTCACGLKMKLPPDFEKPKISCPRCGRDNEIPVAELAAVTAVAEAATKQGAVPGEAKETPQAATYVRKSRGWETFTCSCGRSNQLSPSLSASHVDCGYCGRRTVIKS